MVAQRQYEPANVFDCRCFDMRHLWSPSTQYKGQPTQKPNWFGGFIVPKTQAHWSTEPIFAGVMQAFRNLLRGQLQAFSQNVNAVQWPIADGDMPSPEGKSSDFAKGHWLFAASTGQGAPKVEMAQSNGQLAVLQAKVGIKPGDHCMLGVTAAVKANQANGVKFYLNGLVFTKPGTEIVFAGSFSSDELMKAAQAQGMTVTGFQAGGGFGAPQGGFGQPQQAGFGQSQGGGFGQPQQAGWAPPQGGGGFGQSQGFGAPQGGFGAPPGGFTQGGAPAAPTNPGGFAQPGMAPNGAGFGGNAAFPSNGFAPPQRPFGT